MCLLRIFFEMAFFLKLREAGLVYISNVVQLILMKSYFLFMLAVHFL